MAGKKRKKILIGTALGLTLAAGVSLYPLMRYAVDTYAADFDKAKAVIEGDTVSKQRFYENLNYSDGKWKLTLKNGKVVDAGEITDFRVKDRKQHQVLRNVKLKTTVDTVRVRYAKNGEKQYSSAIVYGMGARDSLGYLPSFGLYSWDQLKMRYFKADNEKLQRIVDKFNDKYNCTRRHEYQHYLNALAGIGRSGQSYETKFVECCLDEVSANVAQLLEQRKNYLDNGKDVSYITWRFKFYADSVKSGKVKPQAGVYTKEEIELIANGVFDVWMKEKFDLYIKKSSGRAINILRKTNYNGIQPNETRHRELMTKCFTIDGIDFYPHIAAREDEIRVKIPNETLKVFRYLKKEKFKKMTYVDKLEQQRIEKGEREYNLTLAKNRALAKMRNILDRSNER